MQSWGFQCPGIQLTSTDGFTNSPSDLLGGLFRCLTATLTCSLREFPGNARPAGSMGVIFTRIEQNDRLTLEEWMNELREQGGRMSRC
jgi:hypothetical protein